MPEETAHDQTTTDNDPARDPARDEAPAGDHAPESADGDKPARKRRRRRRRKPAGEPGAEPGAEANATDAPRAEREPRDDRPADGRPRREERADDESGDRPRKKRRKRKRRAGGDPAGDVVEDAPQKRIRRADADTSNDEVFEQSITFADLGLSDDIMRALDEVGFKRPTYIQSKLIPPALEGRDVLGQAKTGTGKTAAFGLPLLHLAQPGVPMQAVVLAPTRELAIQITDEINDLGRFTRLKAVTIYGGQRIQTQVDKLAKGPEIIVGTPGRILDMIDRRYLHFQNVRFAVLDEVDRMFDIGFRDDIRKILRRCPDERQTLVVSATLTPEVEDLARRHMRSPDKIVTSAGSLTASMVEQHYITAEPWDKKRLLVHVLTHEEPALTLVFCRLKRTVDELARHLNKKGIEAHTLHGDMSQSQRNSTMRRFKEGQLAVLIASDVASRGIDVEGITHVVNYDLPEDPDLYVHRIGRTARAGQKGVAWSFVTTAQGKLLTQIEHLVNAEIPEIEYPDFEPAPRPDGWRDEPTGGRPPLDIPVTEPARGRFEADDPTDLKKEDPSKLAEKFPGGVIPTKLPPKLMRGKVRTRGR